MREVSKSSVALTARRVPRRGPTALMLLLGLAGLAGACGQKGPLVLPSAAKSPASAASASAVAPR